MPIDKQVLKGVIIDRIEIIQRFKLIERNFVIQDNVPSIIIGVRRCGKSYMLYQKMTELVSKGHNWDEFLYINFEDERLIGFDVNDFNAILEAHYSISKKEPILFLDEIQNINGWEKFARRMADEKRMIYITGSNSKMLSKEMESVLGGRYLTLPVYTYSFTEYLRSLKYNWNEKTLFSTRGKSEIITYLEEYLNYGGFPELVNIVDKRDYLSSIYNKIFLGDIISRNNITNSIALEIMMKKIAETVMHPISFTRLNNIVSSVGVSVGKSTIIQYLEYVKDSQLIFAIYNYSSKLVDKVTLPKYYFIDTGLMNLFVMDSTSALLENLIAINLIRKYGLKNAFFYKQNVEVDFYIPDIGLMVQVCYSLSDDLTRERELNALVKLSRHISANRMIIITFDEEEIIEKDEKKIEVIPVWKWLLKD